MVTYYTRGGGTMRKNALLRIIGLLTAAAALSVVGCSSDGHTGSGGTGEDGNTPPKPDDDDPGAPEFPANSGQQAHDEVVYAKGPYGVSKGSVIANYKFVGFVNAMQSTDGYQPIQLADFYNPTGNEVFPEGSPYGAGNPKPKVLLINVASVWCSPCNYEADAVLPGKYAKFKPMGGEFLLQLADGPDAGEPATGKHLYNWTTKYDVDYPATIDPSYKLGALFEADAFPANMVISTRDVADFNGKSVRAMEIVDVLAGSPEEPFWDKYEQLLLAN